MPSSESLTMGRRPGMIRKSVAWIFILGTLAINVPFFGSAAQAAYHITPILSCQWSVSPNTIAYEPPLGMRFTVSIFNPTRRRTKIGENRIEIVHENSVLAQTSLPNLDVQPGQRVEQVIQISLKPKGGLIGGVLKTFSAIRKKGFSEGLSQWIDPKKYRIRMVLPTPTGPFKLLLYDGR